MRFHADLRLRYPFNKYPPSYKFVHRIEEKYPVDDKQSQIAERKIGDQQGAGYRGIDAT